LNTALRLFVSFLFAGTVLTTAQTPQGAKEPGLAQTFDKVRTAFEALQKTCADNDTRNLSAPLKAANERWSDAYKAFYEMPNADEQWKIDFDTVNTALAKAISDYGSGATASAIKPGIDSAIATLTTLRTRNGVPDLRAALEAVETATTAMEQAVQAMSGRKLSPEDVAQLQVNLTQATTSWQEFSQAVTDTNALNLNDRQLDRLKDLVDVQNKLFERLNNALASQNRREFLAALSNDDRPLLGIMLLLGFKK
jgi:hypothetical protein